MPANYSIQAEIIDIRHDTPRATDAFLVDTNIWYWIAYTRASQASNPPKAYQTRDYPSYISKALSVRASLYRCGLSLSELAHIIERTEREIFERANSVKIGTKEFRHNHAPAWANVVAEVVAAWGQVKGIATPMDVALDELTTDGAFRRFQQERLDGYDLFILEAMSRTGVIQVITDDGDFSTVAGIRVFTSNPLVIQLGEAQGKMVQR